MANSAEQELSVSRSPEEVFGAVTKAISEMPRVSLVSADNATGEIVARAKWGVRSFGETVRISLESSEPTSTTVRFRSKSRVVTTLWDWGKNRENVDRLAQAVNDNLQV